MLATILFLGSIQLVSAQKETSIKIHFDGNLGLEVEREIAPKFSLTLKSEYNVNQLRPDYCNLDTYTTTFPPFNVRLDTFTIINTERYDIITTNIGGRFYPLANSNNLGLYTGLSLNYQYSNLSDENSEANHQFFVEVPLGYKWRFAKRFVFEFGFTTSIIPVNNQFCDNHQKVSLVGSYFLMAGYQITKNNQNEEESINPITK